MADAEGGEMSRHAFQVAYDGDDPNFHSMDVQELSPALLSFGRLIREANFQLNGRRAQVRILVTSDFEHKCFNINFELVQNILQQISTFLGSDEIKNVRAILTDLGIIGSAGAGGLGVFQYLKWKKGRNIQETRESTGTGDIIVQVEGDGNSVVVSPQVFKLAESPKIRRAIEGALAPLGAENVKRIAFRENDKEVVAYNELDAKEIIASLSVSDLIEVPTPEETDEPDIVTAWLRVYSPVFDRRSEKWRFIYGDHPIYADISDTSIAPDAIQRGGSFVNDLYTVRMEVRQHLTEGGEVRPEYKIIRVLDFRPAPQQGNLPLSEGGA
jgi:hypothetical protein